MDILAVDDQHITRQFYELCLREMYNIDLSSNAQEALGLTRKKQYDLYIVDLMMPGMNGIEFIRKLRKINDDPAVLVISQTDDLDLAIEAFRENPVNFLRKPVQKPILLHAVEKSLKQKQIQTDLQNLAGETARDANCPEPVFGESEEMNQFWKKTQRIAESGFNAAVLISGESGTGKEVVARWMHSVSKRAAKPFITLNCGLLTPEIAASEILGIESGVATGVRCRVGKFQVAHEGTLFLDEIAELPLDIQPVFLRVLQNQIVTPVGSHKEHQTDVMIISATNKDLKQCVEDGTFREDLYYRLSVVQLDIPPLRSRISDIPQLLQHLYRRHGGQNELPLSSDEIDAWRNHDWPGNIRQLESALINRIIIGKPVDPASNTGLINKAHKFNQLDRLVKENSWKEIKALIFNNALKQADGNSRSAARMLGVSPTTMWDFAKKLNIE